MDYGSYRYLSVEVHDDRVAHITMNRPERLNAADDNGLRELIRIWSDVDADPDVNVALITGAGSAFCAGGDVTDEPDVPPAERAHRMGERNTAAVSALLNLRKPLVSAINGVAVGAGLRLALLADISIASDRARLIDGHAKLGITAGDHSALIWPLLCGMARAKWLLLRNLEVSGSEAERLGLVSTCVPHETLMAEATAIAAELAAGPQWALRGTKRALNHWLRVAAPAFEHSATLEALNTLHPDADEGIAAFREKRPPRFPSSGLGAPPSPAAGPSA